MFIIDGHNLIGVLPDIQLSETDGEQRLLQRLRAFRARSGGRTMIVFFDAPDLPAHLTDLSSPGVQVRFAERGQSAEISIVEYLRGRDQPAQYVVVTNDQELARRAQDIGARVLPASEFAARVTSLARSSALPAELSYDPRDSTFTDLHASFIETEKQTMHSRREERVDVATWIDRLERGEPQLATRAARWLGLSGGQEAVEPLRLALLHDDPGVRAAAILALGDLGDPAALPDLCECLASDHNSMVREAAAQSLGRIGNRSVEVSLEKAANADPKSKVRKVARDALEQIRARHYQGGQAERRGLEESLDLLLRTQQVSRAVFQRLLMESAVAWSLKSRRNLGFDDALDLMRQELDIQCLGVQDTYRAFRREVERIFSRHQRQVGQAGLDSWSALLERVQITGEGLSVPPSWLAETIVALTAASGSLLLLDWGNSLLGPLLVSERNRRQIPLTQYVSLDDDSEAVERQRLLIALTTQHLEQVRESVRQYRLDEAHFPGAQDTSNPIAVHRRSESGARGGDIADRFDAIVANLLADRYSDRSLRADLIRHLAPFLSEWLTLGGRAVLVTAANLLDSEGWAELRQALGMRLSIEAVVDLSLAERQGTFAGLPRSLALVILRRAQQSAIRSQTILAPLHPERTAKDPEAILNSVVHALGGKPNKNWEKVAFERPTSELSERWDPKYYCPERVELQDRLIRSPYASWLGSVTQLIARGSSPQLLRPLMTAKVDQKEGKSTRSSLSMPVQVGDQVWLRRESDQSEDYGIVRVERLSGALLGHLPASTADQIARALDDLGGKLKAKVIETDFTSKQERHITIQFVSPEYSQAGEVVAFITPKDIVENRLTGPGEKAWLPHPAPAQAVRLQASDILLALKGFGKACVVPGDMEGALCSADLAVLRPNRETDSLYLLSAILTSDFQEQLRFVARGTALPSVQLRDLEEILLILPPLDVQRRLALGFAESQGMLASKARGRSETPLTSGDLSVLFSDWDQIHTLDDWAHRKGESIRALRARCAVDGATQYERLLAAALTALDNLTQIIQVLAPNLRPRFDSPDEPQGGSQPLHAYLDQFQAEVEELPTEITEKDGFIRLAAILRRLLLLEVARPTTDAYPQTSDAGPTDDKTSGGIQEKLDLTESAFPDAAPFTDTAPFSRIEPNPYITGTAVEAPEMFFGRQDILDFLRGNLVGKYQNNVIVLQGNRRTGKSSILKQVIKRDLFAPNIPVYLDCQGMGSLTDRRFYFKLAREIVRALPSELATPPPAAPKLDDFSEADPFDDFLAFLDQIRGGVSGRRVILMIDEFELIGQAIQEGKLSSSVLEQLRHLFQHRQDLAVILTGSYRLKRLTEEYWAILFGLGLKRNIGFLDRDAAVQLITKPLEGQASFEEAAIQFILQLTACQPFFVQMLCHNLVNVLNMRNTYFVTVAEVEEAAQETLTSADDHLRFMFRSAGGGAAQAILVYIAANLSHPDLLPLRTLVSFIEEHRLPLTRGDLEELLQTMSERDLIEIREGHSSRLYGFRVDLLRQWIRRNHDLQSAIALAQSAPYVREE